MCWKRSSSARSTASCSPDFDFRRWTFEAATLPARLRINCNQHLGANTSVERKHQRTRAETCIEIDMGDFESKPEDTGFGLFVETGT